MATLRFGRTTPACRLAPLAGLALVTAVALGGCGAAGPAPSPTSPSPTAGTAPDSSPGAGNTNVAPFVPAPAALQTSISYPASLDGLPSNADINYPSEPRGSVPAGFVTEKVFICRPGAAEVGGAVKDVVQQEELEGDFAPLLAALAVPSDRAGGQPACRAVLETIPVLWLVNAGGEAVDAAWPTNECREASGKPGTQKAIDALTVVASTVVAGRVQ